MSNPPTHLIIVCCHAIYLRGREGGSANEAHWLIEPFQAGETGTYIKHIEAGVKALAEDTEDAILVFSGGATKRERTGVSEAEGYLNVALENNLFGLETSPPTLRDRLFLDQYATDSYQNILLSFIQFPIFAAELAHLLSDEASSVGTSNSRDMLSTDPAFPIRLTIISHAFKRARFLNLHLPALQFLPDRTTYIGIDPPFDPIRMAEIEEGDRLRGFGAWEKDLYGAGEVLRSKREKRGWDEDVFRKLVLARFDDGEVRKGIEELMEWNGGDSEREIWPGDTPWG